MPISKHDRSKELPKQVYKFKAEPERDLSSCLFLPELSMAQTVQKGHKSVASSSRRQQEDSSSSSPPAKKKKTATARKSTGGLPPASRKGAAASTAPRGARRA